MYYIRIARICIISILELLISHSVTVGKITFFIGEIKKLVVFKLERFQINLKNIGKAILGFYEKCNSLSKFTRKFNEKYIKFWKSAFWGFGGRAPEAFQIIKNVVDISMET